MAIMAIMINEVEKVWKTKKRDGKFHSKSNRRQRKKRKSNKNKTMICVRSVLVLRNDLRLFVIVIIIISGCSSSNLSTATIGIWIQRPPHRVSWCCCCWRRSHHQTWRVWRYYGVCHIKLERWIFKSFAREKWSNNFGKI